MGIKPDKNWIDPPVFCARTSAAIEVPGLTLKKPLSMCIGFPFSGFQDLALLINNDNGL